MLDGRADRLCPRLKPLDNLELVRESLFGGAADDFGRGLLFEQPVRELSDIGLQGLERLVDDVRHRRGEAAAPVTEPFDHVLDSAGDRVLPLRVQQVFDVLQGLTHGAVGAGRIDLVKKLARFLDAALGGSDALVHGLNDRGEHLAIPGADLGHEPILDPLRD